MQLTRDLFAIAKFLVILFETKSAFIKRSFISIATFTIKLIFISINNNIIVH